MLPCSPGSQAPPTRYATDPHHVEVVERLVRPILASRHAVQVVGGPA